MLATLRGDLRLALRMMARRPAFAAGVVLSLGVAMGAGMAATSVVDALRFRALPLPDADRLVLISEIPAGDDAGGAALCRTGCNVSYLTFSRVIEPATFDTVEHVAAFAAGGKALDTGDDRVTVAGLVASPALFDVLNARPALGRLFTPDDNRLGAEPVALLGHGVWTAQFGQRPSIVGERVHLSDTQYTVVGVMPPGFQFETGAAFWLPVVPALDPSTRPSITGVTVVGRLADDATLDHLQAELDGFDPALAASGPGGRATRLVAAPFRTRYTEAADGIDVLFLLIVACVIVIACANVSNLFVSRALDERPAFAIRASIGAGPGALVRLLLVQHGVLVASGSLLGVAIAAIALSAIRAADAFQTLRLAGMDYQLDGRVLLVATIVAVLVAGAVSAIPLFVALGSRSGVGTSTGDRASGGRTTRMAQQTFVAAQVACSVALAVGAGLVTRSLVHLAGVDVGFDTRALVQATPSYPHDWRVPERFVPATRRIADNLGALAGVERVGVRAFVALDRRTTLTPAGHTAPLDGAARPSAVVAVDRQFFDTLGIRIIAGRPFEAADAAGAPVAIVNEWAARHWWGGASPVGARLRLAAPAAEPEAITVVGVVADNKASLPSLLFADDGPALFRPYEQTPSAFPSFFVRTRSGAAGLVAPIRRALAAEVPFRPVSTQLVEQQVAQQFGGVRASAQQTAVVAAACFFLALVGVHALLAQAVSRRTRELGIRRALGASGGHVRGLVVREALAAGVAGIGAGLLAAAAGASWIAPLLRGTSPRDPVVYAAIAAVSLLAVAASAWLPARRAARVSPLVALRP